MTIPEHTAEHLKSSKAETSKALEEKDIDLKIECLLRATRHTLCMWLLENASEDDMRKIAQTFAKP